MRKIILASASPRRSQILEWAEVPHMIVTPGCQEDYPAELSHEQIAIYIAQNKAMAVQKQISKNNQYDLRHGLTLPILAADTIVILGDSVIGKPQGRNEAIKTLQQLSGSVHKVITGVCILYKNSETSFSDTTLVEFNQLSDSQIEYYIDKYKPFDKAGSYAIQEWIGIIGIKSINGDYYNVMGLPINRIVREINLLGK